MTKKKILEYAPVSATHYIQHDSSAYPVYYRETGEELNYWNILKGWEPSGFKPGEEQLQNL